MEKFFLSVPRTVKNSSFYEEQNMYYCVHYISPLANILSPINEPTF